MSIAALQALLLKQKSLDISKTFKSLFNLGRGRLKLTWGEAIKRDLKPAIIN
jgi:hypothetical protein